MTTLVVALYHMCDVQSRNHIGAYTKNRSMYKRRFYGPTVENEDLGKWRSSPKLDGSMNRVRKRSKGNIGDSVEVPIFAALCTVLANLHNIHIADSVEEPTFHCHNGLSKRQPIDAQARAAALTAYRDIFTAMRQSAFADADISDVPSTLRNSEALLDLYALMWASPAVFDHRYNKGDEKDRLAAIRMSLNFIKTRLMVWYLTYLESPTPAKLADHVFQTFSIVNFFEPNADIPTVLQDELRRHLVRLALLNHFDHLNSIVQMVRDNYDPQDAGADLLYDILNGGVIVDDTVIDLSASLLDPSTHSSTLDALRIFLRTPTGEARITDAQSSVFYGVLQLLAGENVDGLIYTVYPGLWRASFVLGLFWRSLNDEETVQTLSNVLCNELDEVGDIVALFFNEWLDSRVAFDEGSSFMDKIFIRLLSHDIDKTVELLCALPCQYFERTSGATHVAAPISWPMIAPFLVDLILMDHHVSRELFWQSVLSGFLLSSKAPEIFQRAPHSRCVLACGASLQLRDVAEHIIVLRRDSRNALTNRKSGYGLDDRITDVQRREEYVDEAGNFACSRPLEFDKFMKNIVEECSEASNEARRGAVCLCGTADSRFDELVKGVQLGSNDELHIAQFSLSVLLRSLYRVVFEATDTVQLHAALSCLDFGLELHPLSTIIEALEVVAEGISARTLLPSQSSYIALHFAILAAILRMDAKLLTDYEKQGFQFISQILPLNDGTISSNALLNCHLCLGEQEHAENPVSTGWRQIFHNQTFSNRGLSHEITATESLLRTYLNAQDETPWVDILAGLANSLILAGVRSHDIVCDLLLGLADYDTTETECITAGAVVDAVRKTVCITQLQVLFLVKNGTEVNPKKVNNILDSILRSLAEDEYLLDEVTFDDLMVWWHEFRAKLITAGANDLERAGDITKKLVGIDYRRRAGCKPLREKNSCEPDLCAKNLLLWIYSHF